MKKFLAFLMMLLMVCSCALAEDGVSVYVSITDAAGVLVLAYEEVAVTDIDGDGVVSIGDALTAAHIQKHENGADAFGLVASEYGLSMTKLWGTDNGGSYGYCINDGSAWSLLDPVAQGDHVKAYAYTDLAAWSDTYSYFNVPAAEVKAGEALELVLTASGYDENFAPVSFAVEGAAISVDGSACEITTDAEGKVTLTFAAAGTYVVSASSETMTLVAPVCVVTVTE